MNKKSIMKILFTGLFLLIATMSSSHFSPENEIKTIETLPKKPHATLDIEVTKVKSQPIVGNLDKENKNIIIDFSTINDNKQNKMIIDESNYSLFATNSLNTLPSYSSNKARVKSETAPKYSFEKIADKIIKVKYVEKPENLYIGVLNKSTNNVDSVFKVNINEPSLATITTRKMFINNPVYLSTNTSSNLTGVYGFNGSTSNFLPYNLPGSKYSARFLSGPPTSYGLESSGWTTNPNVTLEGFLNGISIGNFYPTSENNSILKKGQYIYFKNSNNIETTFDRTSIFTNTTNEVLVPKFSNINGTSGYVGVAFTNWDLKKNQFTLKIIDQTNQTGNIENIEINVPPLDPKSYLDTTIATTDGAIKPSAGSWNTSTTTYNYNTSIYTVTSPDYLYKEMLSSNHRIGFFKIWDTISLPQIAPDTLNSADPLKFILNTETITFKSTTNSSHPTFAGTLYIGNENGDEIANTSIEANKCRELMYLWIKFTSKSSDLPPGVIYSAKITETTNGFFLKLGTNEITSSLIDTINISTSSNGTGSARFLLINNPVYLYKDDPPNYKGIYSYGSNSKFNPIDLNNTKYTANFYGTNVTANNPGISSYTNNAPSTYGLSPEWPLTVLVSSTASSSDKIYTSSNFINTYYGPATGYSTNDVTSSGGSFFNFRKMYSPSTNQPFLAENSTTTVNPLENEIIQNRDIGGPFKLKLLNSGGRRGYIGIGIYDWNLKNGSFAMKISPNDGTYNYDAVRLRVAPFDPEAYYDNANSSIKIDAQNTNIDTSSFWDVSGIKQYNKVVSYNHNHKGANIQVSGTLSMSTNPLFLGTIKIFDENILPQIASDIVRPEYPLQFYTQGAITLVDPNNSSNTITGTIYFGTPGVTTISAENARNLVNVYLKLDNPKLGNFSVTAYQAPPVVNTGGLTNNTGTNLLRLGTLNPTNIVFDNIIDSITVTIGTEKSTSFTLKDPIPRIYNPGSSDRFGMYLLSQGTAGSKLSPVGSPTKNQNTFQWGSTGPIDSVYGISVYSFNHKVLVELMDSKETTTYDSQILLTGSDGKLNGFVNVQHGDNEFVFGETGNNRASIALNNWSLNAENYVLKISQYYGNAPINSSPFAIDKFGIKISAFDPLVYYDNDTGISNPSFIALGEEITQDIKNEANFTIPLKSVILYPNDRRITITPSNPDGITFYLGDSGTGTVTFKSTTTDDTVTGTLSLSGTVADDMNIFGRVLSLNIDGTQLKGGQTYVADSPVQLGVTKDGTPYYGTILSKLIIKPSYVLKEASFNISNPVAQANEDGTGIYFLNDIDGNPNNVPTNNGTLKWDSGKGPISPYGISLYPKVHNIGVWITDGVNSRVAASFTTDSDGKITGSKLLDSINGIKFLVGSFQNAFGIGINEWDTFPKSKIQIAVHHFENGIDPITSTVAQAFASDIFTMGMDELDPKVYFDSTNSTIPLNSTVSKTLVPPGVNPIALGSVQLNNTQKTITGDPNSGLKFLGNNIITLSPGDGSGDITAQILIDGKTLVEQKLVNDLGTTTRNITLLPSKPLLAGKTYSASSTNEKILVLGVEGRGNTSSIPTDSIDSTGVYANIISNLSLQTTAVDSLVIEILNDSGQWEVIQQGIAFDHGSVVKGQDIPKPTLYKNFRVRRWNNSPLNIGTFNLNITNAESPLILNNDPLQKIDHRFVPTIDNATPTAATKNFKISSEIQSTKVSDTLPVGVYQKTSDVIINITP